MEVTFQFTREAYEKTLAELLRQQRRRPLNLILLLLMTLGQFGFVLWSIHYYQTPAGQTALLLVLSLAIALLQILYFLAIGLRARAQTERAIRKGSISPDFWSKQRLSLKDEVLRLRCGKTELRYDCAYFRRSRQVGDVLLLDFQKDRTVHQLMIPTAAFSAPADLDAFLAQLKAYRRSSILGGVRQERMARPETPDYALSYHYTAEDFSRDQVRAARAAWFSHIGWPLSNIAKVAAAAFLLWHLAKGSFESTGMIVFIVLVLLVLLYPLLLSFSPLCRVLVKRNTASLFCGLEEMDCSLDLKDRKLYYIGDCFENVIPLESVDDLVERRHLTILYLRDNTSITIPLDADEDPETRRLVVYLAKVAELNWKNRRGRDLLR